MGNPKYRKTILKAINERPMNVGGVEIEQSEKEKYLGDMIHEKGCKEIITANINKRESGKRRRNNASVRNSNYGGN